MRGPIDYIVVGFEGNNFDGSILTALGDALDKGIIGLVALSFIAKDSEGTVVTLNMADMDNELVAGFTEKYKATSELVTEDDINEVSELIENDTAAGLLIVEQLWAKPLKQAIVNANGFLIAEGRIHPEAAAELN